MKFCRFPPCLTFAVRFLDRVVVREKFIFDIAYEKVGVARSHGVATTNILQDISKMNFSLTTMDQNRNFRNVSSTTASAVLHPAKRNSTNSLLQSILSNLLSNTPGTFLKIYLLSSTLNFQSTAAVYLQAHNTNQQIPITT